MANRGRLYTALLSAVVLTPAIVLAVQRETPPAVLVGPAQEVTPEPDRSESVTASTSPDLTKLVRCGTSERSSNMYAEIKTPGLDDGFATREQAAARAFAVYFGGLPKMPDRLLASSEEVGVSYSVTDDGAVELTEGLFLLASVQIKETTYGRFVLDGVQMCDDAIDQSRAIKRIDAVVSDTPEDLTAACRAYFVRLAEVFPGDESNDQDACSSLGGGAK